MKKIVFSIGILLFLGLMLFNVNSSQHLFNSDETIAVLELEEMNVMADPPLYVHCFINFESCAPGTPGCWEEYWCPGGNNGGICSPEPMLYVFGSAICEPS